NQAGRPARAASLLYSVRKPFQKGSCGALAMVSRARSGARLEMTGPGPILLAGSSSRRTCASYHFRSVTCACQVCANARQSPVNGDQKLRQPSRQPSRNSSFKLLFTIVLSHDVPNTTTCCTDRFCCKNGDS